MSNTATETKPNGKALANVSSAPIAPATQTISQKFVGKVSKQFEASMGTPLSWTTLQMSLAQNLYIKIDQALTDLETKRQGNNFKKNDPPITWDNVNMEKLARDAVARVKMELDAQLPNMIHVIPYLNSRTKKYDVDIRVGYMGVDHVSRNFSAEKIVDIKYRLVHESDIFEVKIEDGVETPFYKQTKPFDPGAVIGGYGYIMYEDPRMNRLYICEHREFEKAEKASKGVEFWGGEQTVWVDGKKTNGGYDEKFKKEMQFKTLVIRTNKHVKLDPSKINSSDVAALASASADYDAIEAEMVSETDENANKETLSLSQESTVGEKAPVQETRQEAPAQQSQDSQPGLQEEANF